VGGRKPEPDLSKKKILFDALVLVTTFDDLSGGKEGKGKLGQKNLERGRGGLNVEPLRLRKVAGKKKLVSRKAGGKRLKSSGKL